MILGTAGYMSPEQARGKPVDRRADVWAFGYVLYELLAGQRAFPGETISDCVAAVLGKEPEWNALPVSTPRQVPQRMGLVGTGSRPGPNAKTGDHFRIGDFDRRGEISAFDRDPDGVSFGGQLRRHDQ